MLDFSSSKTPWFRNFVPASGVTDIAVIVRFVVKSSSQGLECNSFLVPVFGGQTELSIDFGNFSAIRFAICSDLSHLVVQDGKLTLIFWRNWIFHVQSLQCLQKFNDSVAFPLIFDKLPTYLHTVCSSSLIDGNQV
jgi:hypothetical protein